MARDQTNGSTTESVISIIAPGTKIVGDCETDGTIRVEGIVKGSVRAGKAVVIGKQGLVAGDIETQDALIAGRVEGSVKAASRLELQATCQIDGEIHTDRMQLEEGAILNGTVHMGSNAGKSSRSKATTEASQSPSPQPAAAAGSRTS